MPKLILETLICLVPNPYAEDCSRHTIRGSMRLASKGWTTTLVLAANTTTLVGKDNSFGPLIVIGGFT